MSYNTGQGILTAVLSRADELGVGQADRESDARRYIQAGLVAITGEGFNWPWAETIGQLQTFAAITTGLVSVLNGSNAISFTVPPSALSLVGRKFFVDSDGTVYPILTHTAGSTAATLASVYLGVTATNRAYHIVQDEYDLATNFLRPLQKPFLRDMQGNCHCELIHEDELKWNYAYPGNLGTPVTVAFIQPKRLVFGPVPSSGKLYLYDYLRHPTWGYGATNELAFDGTANDAIIISPPEDGQVVEFYALAHLLNDKNDARGRTFAEATVVKMNDMKRLGLKLRKPRFWVPPGFRVSTPR